MTNFASLLYSFSLFPFFAFGVKKELWVLTRVSAEHRNCHFTTRAIKEALNDKWIAWSPHNGWKRYTFFIVPLLTISIFLPSVAFSSGCCCSNCMGLHYFWQLFLFLSLSIAFCLCTHTHIYSIDSLILFISRKHMKTGTIMVDLKDYVETSHRIQQHCRNTKYSSFASCPVSGPPVKSGQYRSSTRNPRRTVQPKQSQMESSFVAYLWRKTSYFSFLLAYSFIIYSTTISLKNQKASIDKLMIM